MSARRSRGLRAAPNGVVRAVASIMLLCCVVAAGTLATVVVAPGTSGADTSPSTWTQLSPATSPPVREDASMAYDPATGTVVLFGGYNGSALSDTWSWNGATWSQLTPATSPPARWSATMAYDPATGTLVLFGGYSGSSYLSDTWSWNGTTWSQLAPADSPPARGGAMMDYDPAISTMVLFGGSAGSGFLSDTWTWNGTTWSQLTPADSPPGRLNGTMAYDPATDTMVLFGGAGITALADTWTWNGTNWSQLTPAASPSTRYGASMAYDPATGTMVLFGGDGSSGPLSDTWTWNGTTWSQLTLAASPPARVYASMAYDTATGDMVLFGGDGSSANLNDIWTYGFPAGTPTAWTQLSPAASPSTRSGASMAYDPATGNMVLFGGTNSSNTGAVNDTWTWNGTTWTELSPTTSPSARQNASMAYDPATGDMVLFGGYAGGYVGDTWTWNGTTWTKLSPATSPSAREAASMAYDPATGNMVLFGGGGGSGLNDDTWTWNGTTWAELSPTTSPGNRWLASMAYDPATGNMVLFGGYNGSEYRNDTWTWSGTTWTELSPTTSPSARQNASMAYDPATGDMVLFGGYAGGYVGNTWTWNGTTWTEQSPATSAPARSEASMAYDPATGNMVLFGGDDSSGTLNDTWTYGPSAPPYAPTVSQTFSPSSPVLVNTTVTDTATLTGASPTAGGTVSYAVYSNSGCTDLASSLGSSVAVTNGVPGTSDSWTATAGNHWFSATYSGDTLDSGPVSSSCQAFTVDNPSVSLTKSASPTSFSGADQTINYSYVVNNTGNVTLANVTVTDNKVASSSINCGSGSNVIASLAANVSVTCTAPYAATQADVDNGSINNTGTAIGTPPVGPNVSATSSVTIPYSQITLVKSANPTSFTGAGQTITYSYLVTNTGTTTVNDLSVTDPMSGLSAINCGATSSLAPLASVTCTATYTTTANDVSTGSISNTGTAGGTDQDGNPVSATASLTIPYSATAPNAPTAVKAITGRTTTTTGSLTVTYTPGSDNGAAFTHFTATCMSSNGGVTKTGTHSGAVAAPITVTGVTTGKTYRCTVEATNTVGTGSASVASASVIVGSPAPPTQVKAVAGSTTTATGSLTVTFTLGANNGSAISSQTASCTSSNGGVTKTGTHRGADAAPIAVAGLTTGKTYTCTVTDTNARGKGLASARSLPVVVGSPAAPTRVTATRVAAGQIKVGFTPGSDNGSRITGYTASCTSSNGGVPGVKSGGASPLAVTGLTAGDSYRCTVAATNARGTSPVSATSGAVTA